MANMYFNGKPLAFWLIMYCLLYCVISALKLLQLIVQWYSVGGGVGGT